MALPNNQAWKKFFTCYKNLPELWDVNNDTYKIKSAKCKGWEILLEEYRNIEPEATIEKLKTKINSIRTCYRRELKKVHQFKKSGIVYISSLWYMPDLDFLQDEKVLLPRISSSVNLEMSTNDRKGNPVIMKKYKNCPKGDNMRNIFLQKAVDHLERKNKEKDEATIYSEGWACSFRKLSEEQKLFAKRAIDEILILGQLNRLSINCVAPHLSPQNSWSSPSYDIRSSSPNDIKHHIEMVLGSETE